MAQDKNEWKPEQNTLIEASVDLQEVKNKFDKDSLEHKKIQRALDKIKAVIFNYA